ncbi:hypothetical protein EJ02DRAFT_163958 [Clathrospora elynae]|uniref:Uncharacterized protein n=1 Tax=Clathrospora elynae TaxID=706981 RepID=A0A6A5SPU8_9PLEO|nr:hypothetical protein EJ02DRAFT_163958 [Clathrospora elynae]
MRYTSSSMIITDSCSENSAQGIRLLGCSLCCNLATPLHLLQLAVHQSDAHGYVKLVQNPVSDLLQVCLWSAFKKFAEAAPVDVSKCARSTNLHTGWRIWLTPRLQTASLFPCTVLRNPSLVIYLRVVNPAFNAIEDCLQSCGSKFVAVMANRTGHCKSHNTKILIAIVNSK